MSLRFLLIQTAFLGDVVLATAVVEKLHQAYPDASIDVVVRKGAESLLAQHPFLRKVWVWDKQQAKGFNLLRLGRALRQERFTHVINLQRFFSSGLLTALTGSPVRLGFDKNPLSWLYTQRFPHHISEPYARHPIHEVARNQSLIAHLTDSQPAHPAVYPSPDEEAAAAVYKSTSYCCISPASVWTTKQYPAAGWAQLLKALPENLTVYLLGGKGDTSLANEILRLANRPAVHDLTGKLSLLASAALMRDAHHNWVNDSAPLHLCTATGARVTAVFCSTVPAFGFGPLPGAGTVAEVPERLYCRPCGLHGHRQCPEGHFRCAKDIPLSGLLQGFNFASP